MALFMELRFSFFTVFLVLLIYLASCSITKCYMVSNDVLYHTTIWRPSSKMTAAQLLHFQGLFCYNCSLHSRPFICSSVLLTTSSNPPWSCMLFFVLSVKSSCLPVFIAVNLPLPTPLNCSHLYDPLHLTFTPSP